MSELQTIETDLENDFEAVKTAVEGSKVGQVLKGAYNAAIAELAKIGPQAIETAVESIGVAALGGLTSTGTTEGAIAAGIAAAPAAFKAAEATVSTTTTHTLVSAVVQGLAPASSSSGNSSASGAA